MGGYRLRVDAFSAQEKASFLVAPDGARVVRPKNTRTWRWTSARPTGRRGLGPLGLNQIVLERFDGRLSPIGHLQLRHDALDVSLDRIDAEDEDVGDLFVVASLAQEAEH